MSGVGVFFDELQANEDSEPFSISQMEHVLLRLLDGESNNDLASKTLQWADIPVGWTLRNDVLETARNSAILEYHLIYAYNDYAVEALIYARGTAVSILGRG